MAKEYLSTRMTLSPQGIAYPLKTFSCLKKRKLTYIPVSARRNINKTHEICMNLLIGNRTSVTYIAIKL